MKSRLYCFFLLLVLAAPAMSTQKDLLTKQQAVNIARQVYPGRVLAVKQTARVFRVKTLSKNGDVHIITIDARSGKVIHRPRE